MGARLWPVNHIDGVTDLAVSPAAASGFPVTNLQSSLRDLTYRSPNLYQQEITYSFGGNGRYVNAWGLWPRGEIPGSCMIGAKVQHLMYTDASRATSPIYNSGVLDWFTFTNPVWGSFPYGAGPWGVESCDYTARLAAIARHITRVPVGSGKLIITNGGAVDTNFFEMRRFFVSEAREAPFAPNRGMTAYWITGSELKRTLGMALHRLRRPVRRGLRCTITLLSEADRAAWAALCYAAEPGAEIVFSPFDYAQGPRKFRDHLVLGSLEVLNPEVWEDLNVWKLELVIVES